MEESQPLANTTIAVGAGFGIRAAARVIDTVYGLLLALMGGILGGIILVLLEQAGLVASGWEERTGGADLAGWGLGLLGNVFYHSLTEGMYGASLGKLLCGLRVVSEVAQPITTTQALKRSLAYFWDALFFGLVGYSSMKKSELNQRYGDHWARTIVVKAGEVPAESKSGWEMFVLAFLMGSVGWMLAHLLGVIIHVR